MISKLMFLKSLLLQKKIFVSSVKQIPLWVKQIRHTCNHSIFHDSITVRGITIFQLFIYREVN